MHGFNYFVMLNTCMTIFFTDYNKYVDSEK